MRQVLKNAPRVALLLTGVAAGCLVGAGARRKRSGVGEEDVQTLKRSLAELEERLNVRQAETADRLAKVETRLEEHAAALAAIPSSAQFVSAMEQVLAKAMSSLDARLTTQAHSIEVLKAALSQNDRLLERVLQSLESIQGAADPLEAAQDDLLRRPAV